MGGHICTPDVEEREEAEAEKQLRKAAAEDFVFQEDGLASPMNNATRSMRESTRVPVDRIGAHNTLSDRLLVERSGYLAYKEAIDDD